MPWTLSKAVPKRAALPGDPYAEAALALHSLSLRRQFDGIRIIFGDKPPHRAREALWVLVEVTLAHLRGRPIALKDLVSQAEGLISAPTLSRAIAELIAEDLVTAEPAAEDSRVRLLRPTTGALNMVTTRAEEAFAEFADIVKEAEQRIVKAT